jgi:hypothetical protein
MSLHKPPVILIFSQMYLPVQQMCCEELFICDFCCAGSVKYRVGFAGMGELTRI